MCFLHQFAQRSPLHHKSCVMTSWRPRWPCLLYALQWTWPIPSLLTPSHYWNLYTSSSWHSITALCLNDFHLHISMLNGLPRSTSSCSGSLFCYFFKRTHFVRECTCMSVLCMHVYVHICVLLPTRKRWISSYTLPESLTKPGVRFSSIKPHVSTLPLPETSWSYRHALEDAGTWALVFSVHSQHLTCWAISPSPLMLFIIFLIPTSILFYLQYKQNSKQQ